MATHSISLPVSESGIRRLRIGDEVRLSGVVYTGRDRLHKHLAEGRPSPADLRGGAIFHCGPVVVPDPAAPGAPWRIVAAGPTTSCREEPYMAGIVGREGLRAIIGKGGMGPATDAACRSCGCTYLQAVGGAAALLARCVKRVLGVHFLEDFGATEAMWALQVEDFTALVGIDATGASLFDAVKNSSADRLAALLRA